MQRPMSGAGISPTERRRRRSSSSSFSTTGQWWWTAWWAEVQKWRETPWAGTMACPYHQPPFLQNGMRTAAVQAPPSIRTTSLPANGKVPIEHFYYEHPQGAQVPLIFFVHGLSGCIDQWEKPIRHMMETANVLAVNLPGSGHSDHTYLPALYGTEALVHLLSEVLARYVHQDQAVAIVAHSYGCALVSHLFLRHAHPIACMVYIAPKYRAPHTPRWLASLPSWTLDLWRKWDRRDAEASSSVYRLIPKSANPVQRRAQLYWNQSVATPLLQCLLHGMVFPSAEDYARITCPVLLLRGELDTVSTMSDIEQLMTALPSPHVCLPSGSPRCLASPKRAPTDAATAETLALPSAATITGATITGATTTGAHTATPTATTGAGAPQGIATSTLKEQLDPPAHPTQGPTAKGTTTATPVERSRNMLEATIIPQAAHAPHHTAPGLTSALISKFLTTELPALDPTAALFAASPPSQKWDLKNAEKWARTPAMSVTDVGGSRIWGMKIMRESDEEHNPSAVKAKADGRIGLVIDLSNQEPTYDTAHFGIDGYVKLPAQSKIVPTDKDVRDFVDIVHHYLSTHPDQHVAVHCHYGFNRTGFLICAFLIEKLDFAVEDAMEAFKMARPDGIRHKHFKDELFWRYGRTSADRYLNARRTTTSAPSAAGMASELEGDDDEEPTLHATTASS